MSKHLVLFCAFVGVLLLPDVGAWLDLDGTEPLGGVEGPEPMPPLRWDTLWSGEYQQALEKNAARSLGFRKALVRTDNQINLSVFHELKPPLALGRNDVVCNEDMHPRSDWWRGDAHPFVPMVLNTRVLQDELKKRGIGMLVVISPRKSRLYVDDLPERMRRYAVLDKVPTFHTVIGPLLDFAKVEVADIAKLFLARSPGEPRVFADGGYHWSWYGAALTAIEVLGRLERQAHVPWPKLSIERLEWLPEPRGTDRDLIDLANLWTVRRFFGQNPDPKLRVDLGGATKKRLLCVGTSYMWTLSDTLAQSGVCSRLEVLFYFMTRVTYVDGVGPREESDKGKLKELAIDWDQELRGFDAVLLEVPDYALPELGYGFQAAVLKSFGLEPAR